MADSSAVALVLPSSPRQRRDKTAGRGGAAKTCVFAKRTHRFLRWFSAYPTYLKILMSFADSVCRWVRFGKRTHREGVFKEVERRIRVRLLRKRSRRVSRSQGCAPLATYDSGVGDAG